MQNIKQLTSGDRRVEFEGVYSKDMAGKAYIIPTEAGRIGGLRKT